MDATELQRLTWEHFPDPFWKAATKAVYLARQEAWDSCRREFADPEADNLRGFYCRAKLEGHLRGVAERHGLGSRPVKHPGQPWNHTEVSNGPVILTAASVSTPCAMVSPADYRRGLAEDAQQHLFPVHEVLSSDHLAFYVILVHSRYRGTSPEDVRKNGHLPGSVYAVWPAGDCDDYVHDLNLMERYPDVAREFVPQDWDEEAILKYFARSRRSAFG